jgi:hypothetical protein
MITFRIQKKFEGPTILEMASLLPLSEESVTVAWSNSKVERLVLRKYPNRDFILVVPDLNAMERTATTLGLPYKLDNPAINGCMEAINNNVGGSWGTFVKTVGPSVSRGIAVRLVADCIREGNDPTQLRKVLVDFVLDNVPPMDADLLLVLRFRGARV